MNAISRNQPCPCGSGKRFKHCCGGEASNPKYEALARQRAGDLTAAEILYRKVLDANPDEPDALHMLGVVHLQAGRPREAFELILRAAGVTGWKVPTVRDNLALALGAVLGGGAAQATVRAQVAYHVWCARRERARRPAEPLVSVVVPSYNHAAYIGECLESVYRQTWPRIELIVIDDGSSDDSAELIRASLQACPFPQRFIARENRGAHATINEGIALARGEFVNILNSDDRFAPERIARMVDCVAGAGADWGFAGVGIIDAAGMPAPLAPGSAAERLADLAESVRAAPTVGFGLLRANAAISTGNMFVRREFLNRIGGMAELRYNHDWEFVMRATLESEPVHVPQPLYYYRLHGANTIRESSSAPKREADAMHAAHLAKLLHAESAPNPFAPIRANWGSALAGFALEAGLGVCLPAEAMRELAHLADADAAGPSAAPFERLPELAPVLALLDALDYRDEAGPSFDQWQRYGTAARAIERLRRPGQVFSILEVGANTHRLLGKLLPNDRITYLDREIPAALRGAPDIVQGDATRLTLPDGSFDLLVALDVFEHIEPVRRQDFLHHVTRVARQAAIVAAPFNSPEVIEAERDVSSYWDRLFAQPYRWLAEHADNGLPEYGATLAALDALGAAHCGFGHGRLDWWQELMKAHFAAEAHPALRPLLAAIDRHYRACLFDIDSAPHGNYRHFLFCARTPAALDPLRALCAEQPGTAAEPLPLIETLAAIQAVGAAEALRRRLYPTGR
jgi:glycosyltransferase involved in cell wall biosynthesis